MVEKHTVLSRFFTALVRRAGFAERVLVALDDDPNEIERTLVRRAGFAERVLAAVFAFFDGLTPLWVKAQLLLAVVYFLSPFDFIPDVLPIIGWIDDVAILYGACQFFLRYVTGAHQVAARRWLFTDSDDDTP